MPNWCNNKMIVKGMTIEKFEDLYFEGKDFTFEKVIPIGEWDHDTAVNAWDTKWDCRDTEIFSEGDGFSLEFLTAWSPPETVLNKLQENHPDASFKLLFVEQGFDICGLTDKTGDYTYEFSLGVEDYFDEDLKSYINYWQEYYSYE